MNEISIDILCRLCLNKSYFYSNIYVGQSTDSYPIYETINYVYDLKISIDDGFPEFVCQECLAMVQEFDKYKKSAQKSKLELTRLKLKIQEINCDNPVNVEGENEPCKNSSEGFISEVQKSNTGLQVFIKQEVEEDGFDVDSSVFMSEGRQADAETKVSLQKGDVVDVGLFEAEYPSMDRPVPIEAQVSIKEEGQIISDNPFDAETTSVEERNCMPMQVSKRIIRLTKETQYSCTNSRSRESGGEYSSCGENAEDEVLKRRALASTSEEVAVEQSASDNSCDEDFVSSSFNVVGTNAGDSFRSRKRNSMFLEEGMPSEKITQKETGDAKINVKKKKKYLCNVCGACYGTRSGLYKHRRYVHGNQISFQCDVCGDLLRTMDSLRQHSLAHGSDKKEVCTDCGKKLKPKDELVTHNRVHTRRGMHPCEHCDQDFEKKGDLLKHLPSHDGEIVWTCEVCGEKITHWADLVSHRDMHKRNIKYKCAHCYKEFSKKHRLGQHMRYHIRPEKCTICHKHFASKHLLERHMLVHTGVREWECHVCQKKFQTKGNLRTHMKVHSSKKPFSCDLCDYKTANRGDLKRHQRIHTDDTFKCPFCPMSSRWRYSILNHQRKLHAEELRKLNAHSDSSCM